MLREIGVKSLEDLFVGIPAELRLKSLLSLPPALSEPELIEKFKSYADKNASGFLSLLGAGVNDHYMPTVIDSLISRENFSLLTHRTRPKLRKERCRRSSNSRLSCASSRVWRCPMRRCTMAAPP